MFLVISDTFLVYKQLSTQGTITSCSLNKLDVKNHWVLRDLENPQALSSARAKQGRYSPGPSNFLNPIEPWFLTSNYYLCCRAIAVYYICSAFIVKWCLSLLIHIQQVISSVGSLFTQRIGTKKVSHHEPLSRVECIVSCSKEDKYSPISTSPLYLTSLTYVQLLVQLL